MLSARAVGWPRSFGFVRRYPVTCHVPPYRPTPRSKAPCKSTMYSLRLVCLLFVLSTVALLCEVCECTGKLVREARSGELWAERACALRSQPPKLIFRTSRLALGSALWQVKRRSLDSTREADNRGPSEESFGLRLGLSCTCRR